MTQIIDRRLNGKNKSVVNRQRFIKRFRGQIKKAVDKALNERSITDIERGEKIDIPNKDISEPIFHHGKGGRREIVQPGNKEFITGDTLPKPQGGQGEGQGQGQASNQGEGEDSFVFELSRDEFLEFFFEDLALPDLIKTQLAQIMDYKSVRAGYTKYGVPSNININRTMRGALARRIAVRGPYKRRLEEIEVELESLDAYNPIHAAQRDKLETEKAILQRKLARIPFIDEFDLRYNNRIRQPKPITQAVMFCLMDVSGSMTQARKDMAKRFFSLLYLFLNRNYEHIDVVFIRHHTTATEVDENEFFYSRESGGTVVSSALELMQKIMQERYSTSEWNIYAAQASDGDNWDDDSGNCREILAKKILPFTQYYAYIEITGRDGQKLWQEYETLSQQQEHFCMRRIEDPADIYPVFRELFKRREAA
ncbi:MAG: YeaH/YhbH family protein [Gammaproteobacteria bacterium]|nr:YeaH/YhbH family protein [Gammaproteobacteria bacterium]